MQISKLRILNLTPFDIFLKSKHKIEPLCTGTCVNKYFRQFVVSLKKIQHYVLFYQETEPAPATKFLEPEPPKKKDGSKTLTTTPNLRENNLLHQKFVQLSHICQKFSLTTFLLL